MLECVNKSYSRHKKLCGQFVHIIFGMLEGGIIMISKLKTHNKVVGAKQVKRAINSSNIEAVFIAEDAEKKVTSNIEELCIDKHIQIIHVKTMKDLGKACGIDINAAVAALLK
jgi:large subunit ribosomal protein L7A